LLEETARTRGDESLRSGIGFRENLEFQLTGVGGAEMYTIGSEIQVSGRKQQSFTASQIDFPRIARHFPGEQDDLDFPASRFSDAYGGLFPRLDPVNKDVEISTFDSGLRRFDNLIHRGFEGKFHRQS